MAKSAKEILLKYKVDQQNWKAAFQDMVRKFRDLQKEERQHSKDIKRDLEWRVKQINLSIGRLRAERDERDKQVKLLERQIRQEKLKEQQARVTLQQERQRTQELKTQEQLLRNQERVARLARAQQPPAGRPPAGGARAAASAGGGGGFLSGAVGAFGSAFSSRFVGGIALGVLTGGGLLAAIEAVGSALSRLADKMAHFITVSGPLQQLTEQFERLSAMRGSGPQKFMEELEEATMGLVDSMTLLRTANQFMQSGLDISDERMLRLTKSVVQLARAQGRDANFAVQTLSRSFLTGQFRSLAFALGIERTLLATRGLSEHMPQAARRQAEFEQVLEAVEERLKVVGEPTLTFTERLQQLNIQIANLFERVALGAVRSAGFESINEALDRLVQFLKDSHQAAEAFGDSLGSVVELLKSASEQIQVLLAPGLEMFQLFVDLGGWVLAKLERGIQQVFGEEAAEFFSKTISDIVRTLTSFKGIMLTLSQVLELQSGVWLALWETIKSMAEGVAALFTEETLEAVYDRWKKRMQEIYDATLDEVGRLELMKMGKKPGEQPPAGGKPSRRGDEDEQYAARLANLEVELQKARSKKELEIIKGQIAEEKLLLEDRYQNGLMKLAEYVAKVKDLRERETQVALKAVDLEVEAQTKALDAEKKRGLAQEEYQKRLERIELEAETRRIQIRNQASQEATQLDLKVEADSRKAKQESSEFEIQLQMEVLKEHERILQERFQKGEVTVSQFLERQKVLWQQELVAFERLERKKFEVVADSVAGRQALEDRIALEKEKNRQREAELERSRPQLELRRAEEDFQRRMRLLQSQREATKLPGLLGDVLFPFGSTAETQVIERMIDEHQRLIRVIEKQRGEVGRNTEEWLKFTEQILEHQAAIARLKNEMQTFTGTLATVFGQLAAAMGGGAGQGFGRAAGIFGVLEAFRRSPAAAALGKPATPAQRVSIPLLGIDEEIPGSPAQPVVNPITGLGKAIKGLGDKTKSASERLQNFGSALAASATVIGGFAQAITGQGGPGVAGLAGASAGAALGGLAGQLPGTLGKTLGPIGAIGGAVIGGVIGIFSGKARKAAEKIAKSITDKFNDVIESLNLGDIKLAAAIQRTEALRREALSKLSGKKGGREQLDKILPQLDQTINQLKAQQRQIFEQMDEALKLLRAPEVYEEHLQAVDAIIRKYQEYVEAGGNVAKANEFLTLSYQRLKERGIDSLQEAEIEAIENAIQHSELLKARADVIDQTRQAIEDILFAGVPTRTRTRAQTQVEQIRRLEEDRDKRLKEIDQQIQLSQRRLDAERQIFGLTENRVQLEARLLELKFIEIDRDMERIRALQTLVTTLQSSGASGLTSLDAILRAVGLLPSSPTGGTGVGIGGGGGGRLRDGLEELYDLRGRQGLGGFAGELV